MLHHNNPWLRRKVSICIFLFMFSIALIICVDLKRTVLCTYGKLSIKSILMVMTMYMHVEEEEEKE